MNLSSFLGQLTLTPSLQVCALVLINIGSILDLASSDWFGDFPAHVAIHVIDSTRPQSLRNLFGQDSEANRIVVWDDGTADRLELQKVAFIERSGNSVS